MTPSVASPLRDPAHEVACVGGLVLDVVVRHAAAAVSAELAPVVVLRILGCQ